MKIQEAIELISEAIILSTKQAPDWVKKTLADKGWGLQTLEVAATEKPNIARHYDYDVVDMYFYVNGKVEHKNAETFAQSIALNRGVDVRLWDDVSPARANMLLVTHHYGDHKKAILYAHPNQMPKQIENKNSNLSDDEKKVLLITKSYISSYRPEYFKRYKVYKNLEEIKTNLVEKGLFTSAGALNIAGKNEVEKIRSEHGLNALEKLFGYGD